MKHKNIYYDNRYKYKLNMLEPGFIMMKLIGVLFVTGIIFRAAGWHWLSSITLFLAGIVQTLLKIFNSSIFHSKLKRKDLKCFERNISFQKTFSFNSH